jgi:membrane protein YdbS with pleckstrin-like domain
MLKLNPYVQALLVALAVAAQVLVVALPLGVVATAVITAVLASLAAVGIIPPQHVQNAQVGAAVREDQIVAEPRGRSSLGRRHDA